MQDNNQEVNQMTCFFMWIFYMTKKTPLDTHFRKIYWNEIGVFCKEYSRNFSSETKWALQLLIQFHAWNQKNPKYGKI